MSPFLFYVLYFVLFGDFIALVLLGSVFWVRNGGAFGKGLAAIFFTTAFEVFTSLLFFVYPGIGVLPEWFLAIRLVSRGMQALFVSGFFLHLLGILGKPDTK